MPMARARIPPELLGHFRRQLLDEILVPLEYCVDVTGIDLSVQGKQERRSAIDHDFDGAAGCKRSPAQFGKRMLQRRPIEVLFTAHGHFFHNLPTIRL